MTSFQQRCNGGRQYNVFVASSKNVLSLNLSSELTISGGTLGIELFELALFESKTTTIKKRLIKTHWNLVDMADAVAQQLMEYSASDESNRMSYKNSRLRFQRVLQAATSTNVIQPSDGVYSATIQSTILILISEIGSMSSARLLRPAASARLGFRRRNLCRHMIDTDQNTVSDP